MTKQESLNKAAQEFGWKDFDNIMFNFYHDASTTRVQLDEVIHRAMDIYVNSVINENNEWKV